MPEEFDELVGKILDLRGVDGNFVSLDGMAWEAIEDHDDGYRSSLGVIKCARNHRELIFQIFPFAQVRLVKIESREREYFDGYHLVDVVDGHLWLKIGTDHSDSYYTWFVFQYDPKPDTRPPSPIITKFGYLASDSIN